jgi:hypothetical protein
MSAGQYWLKGTACFRYIVNGPDRLRWGYHEQSYRVNRIQQKRKTWLFHAEAMVLETVSKTSFSKMTLIETKSRENASAPV